MNERRYRDEEIRAIFGLATSRKMIEPPASRSAAGLTLADIQSIGLEVGLDPAVVARAAAALDARTATLRRSSWGMPIEVGRIVPLPRAPTDHEWERLVAELRTTFGARGRVTVHGSLREWSNGNLHACVEPTEGGYRLRLGTLKSDAMALNLVGATGLTAGAIVFGTVLMGGGPGEAMLGPAMLSAGGVAAFVANLVRLPRWAQQRERQMDHVADRIASILGEGPADDGGVS